MIMETDSKRKKRLSVLNGVETDIVIVIDAEFLLIVPFSWYEYYYNLGSLKTKIGLNSYYMLQFVL